MNDSTFTWNERVERALTVGHNRGIPARQPERDLAKQLAAMAVARGRSLGSYTYEEIRPLIASLGLPPPVVAMPSFMHPNAAGSLVTTVQDYCRFVARIMDPVGPAAISRSALRAMLTPQVAINSALSWALGWGVERNRSRDAIWHCGDGISYKTRSG